jgi:hypothetical protein
MRFANPGRVEWCEYHSKRWDDLCSLGYITYKIEELDTGIRMAMMVRPDWNGEVL